MQKYGSLDQKSSFQNAALICADQKWIDFYALSFSFWGQFFFFKFKSYLKIIRELLNNNYSMRVSQRATVETNPNELAACWYNGFKYFLKKDRYFYILELQYHSAGHGMQY